VLRSNHFLATELAKKKTQIEHPHFGMSRIVTNVVSSSSTRQTVCRAASKRGMNTVSKDHFFLPNMSQVK
jgi:hypothetical protein